MLQSVLAGGHLSGLGPFTLQAERRLEERLGRVARIVTSATHALEMMAHLAGIGPGDEVILPSFTFVSTANAFVLRGARLRFADNDEYGNIRIDEIERLISSRTKAVVAVDYGGASAELDLIREICRRHRLLFLEDAAQAIGASYRGKPLGTTSDMSCLSFHETKNIGCGEGGALVFGDPSRAEWVERAEILREKGTNRSRFFQGLVDKYTWVDVGSSYVLSDLNAALLVPQLERLEEITEKRRADWRRYDAEIGGELAEKGIGVLRTPPHNTSNGHLFALVFPQPDLRAGFIQAMRERGVCTSFHYVALHLSPFGSRYHGPDEPALRECERLSSCLVRLPMFHAMTEDEQGIVVSCVRDWLRRL